MRVSRYEYSMRVFCSYLLLALCTVNFTYADLPDQDQLESELKAFIEAPYQGDTQTITKHISKAEKQARFQNERRFSNYLEQQIYALKQAEASVSDIVIHTAHSYAQTGEHEFCLVLVDSVKSIYGKTFKNSHNYLVVQELPSRTWKYINASQLGRERMLKLYKDLPEVISCQIRTLPQKKIYNAQGKEVTPTRE